ncbi:competence-damaged protein [Pseudomonas aeruginosa]|nr:competence-damaged protein [Pseudomonas aeruginosa]
MTLMESDLTALAARLGESLRYLGEQVSTAESCTGGGIAEAITRIPGSSGWFEAGYVTYSNRQKTLQLEVPESLFPAVGRGQPGSGRGHGAPAPSGTAGRVSRWR